MRSFDRRPFVVVISNQVTFTISVNRQDSSYLKVFLIIFSSRIAPREGLHALCSNVVIQNKRLNTCFNVLVLIEVQTIHSNNTAKGTKSGLSYSSMTCYFVRVCE